MGWRYRSTLPFLVSFLSESRDQYACPCYKTQSRATDRGAPTGGFVFTAGLRTKAAPTKWVLAGVALILDVVDA